MMFKRIFITSSVVISCGAFASETRVTTLQNNGGVQDESDAFLYSGRIARYSVALIELGTAANTDVWAGAMTRVASGISLGATVNRHSWQSTYGLDAATSESLQDRFLAGATSANSILTTANRSVDLLGALALSSENSLGLRISTAKTSNKTSSAKDSTATEQSGDTTELAVGFSHVSTSALDADIKILGGDTYKSYATTATGTTTGTKFQAGVSAKLDARWLMNANDSGFFVNGSIVNRSAKATVSSATDNKSQKFSDQNFVLGGGYAHTPKDQSVKIFAGANLVKTSSKGPYSNGKSGTDFSNSIATSDESVKVDAQWLEANLSGEGKFYENFGLMFGTNYVLYGSSVEKDNVNQSKTETEKDAPSDAKFWSLGLFYAADHARVDASISKDLLHHGPYFVAGNATSPMLGRISATYSF